MVIPPQPAEAIRQGGGLGGISIVIENLHLGGGMSVMDARIFGDQFGEYLGQKIQEHGR